MRNRKSIQKKTQQNYKIAEKPNETFLNQLFYYFSTTLQNQNDGIPPPSEIGELGFFFFRLEPQEHAMH